MWKFYSSTVSTSRGFSTSHWRDDPVAFKPAEKQNDEHLQHETEILFPQKIDPEFPLIRNIAFSCWLCFVKLLSWPIPMSSEKIRRNFSQASLSLSFGDWGLRSVQGSCVGRNRTATRRITAYVFPYFATLGRWPFGFFPLRGCFSSMFIISYALLLVHCSHPLATWLSSTCGQLLPMPASFCLSLTTGDAEC